MFDIAAVENAIRTVPLLPPPERPRLLFGRDDLAGLRARAAARPGVLVELRRRVAELVAVPAASIDPHQAYIASTAAVEVAQTCLLTGDPPPAAWLRERVTALLSMDTWFCHVHVGACRVCDHVMCNLAAHVALVHDLAPELFAPADEARLRTGLRRLHLEPFLDATQGEVEWWFRRDMPSNWKIMCCGETGLAVCGYVEHWPEAREALARAARGVLEVLDQVPAEGDWGEGPGYWFATLWMGLRYARALRRLSGGAVDLFRHPVLRITGDFLTELTTPAGRVYNFGDCNPAIGPAMAEALAMLAAGTGRADWLHAARLAPAATPLFLACDDPTAPAHPSPRRTAGFPACGAATLRTGWGRDALFVGFRAGPSDVGHAHLDANSFMLEAGGQPLVIENPYWPQAHFLGFFDMRGGLRWNFDGPGTVGHSTLLVDGQGQTWGPEHAARLLQVRDTGRCLLAAGEAASAYPGLLRTFTRALLLLPPDRLVIRDLIECEGERHLEWLLHYAGTIRSEGVASLIENGGVRLAVVPFLPDRDQGWRWSDVTRTSLYRHSDSLEMVQPAVRYRSFAPFRRAARAEFLFGFRVGGAGEGDWRFTPAAAGAPWRLEASDSGACMVPDGTGLSLT